MAANIRLYKRADNALWVPLRSAQWCAVRATYPVLGAIRRHAAGPRLLPVPQLPAGLCRPRTPAWWRPSARCSGLRPSSANGPPGPRPAGKTWGAAEPDDRALQKIEMGDWVAEAELPRAGCLVSGNAWRR